MNFFCAGKDSKIFAFRNGCIDNFRKNMLVFKGIVEDNLLGNLLFKYDYTMSSRLEEKSSITEKELDEYDQEMCDALVDN